MSKTVNARSLRDPKAIPSELRNLTKYIAEADVKDILEHAADELEKYQQTGDMPTPSM